MPVSGPRGFNGAKKIDGIKRLMDTTGLLLGVHVTAANIQERAAFEPLLRETARDATTIRKVRADKGYTGQVVADAATKAGVELEIVSGPKPVGGFIVQPRRWVVERTNGSNAPTGGSTTTNTSCASTRPPWPPTKASSSRPRSGSCYADSTRGSCSTRSRDSARLAAPCPHIPWRAAVD